MVKLYTTDDCGWCKLAKSRLNFASIPYEEITDMKVIEEKGFKTVPQLELPDGQILDHNELITWVNQKTQ